ncbi:MAG TPA: LamG domain-containing protein [Polyangia bacterium]|jgi:hypothetical protein|nr:LamG domain-containing protein [Polyangia bacterium]
MTRRSARFGFHSPARLRATLALAVLSSAVGAGCGDATLDLFDPDLGLLAHWALDERQAGSVAVDSSGFGLDATPSANPPTPTSDVPSVTFHDPASLSFNGQDQWLDVGNPPLLNAGGKISIAAWIRPTSIDGYHVVLAHGFRNSPYFELSLRIKDGRYEFTYWNTVDHEGAADIPASDVGTWVHLCGVFDGGQYILYRNGIQAASTADTSTPPANIDAPWAIGARIAPPDPPSRLFQGGVDDVRVYGRALSAAEVGALARR